MRILSSVILALTLTASTRVQAKRLLTIPPMQLELVFGGRGGTEASPGAVCRDAEMEAGTYPAKAGSTVQAAGYFTSLSLSNLSDRASQVKIIFTPRSSLRAAASPASSETILNQPLIANGGSTAAVSPSANVEQLYTIPASGEVTRLISYMCSAVDCMMCFKGSGNRGSGCAQTGDVLLAGTDPQAVPITGRVCLHTIGLLDIRLEVQDDRGALIGSVNTQPGRANGYGQVTHPLTTPANFALNGGRPF